MNGMQSGHGGGHDVPVWEMIAHDYSMSPAKPTLDLEPNYERTIRTIPGRNGIRPPAIFATTMCASRYTVPFLPVVAAYVWASCSLAIRKQAP